MTAAELIAKLSELPPETVIYTEHTMGGYDCSWEHHPVTGIEEGRLLLPGSGNSTLYYDAKPDCPRGWALTTSSDDDW